MVQIKVYIGADHRGFKLKERLKTYLIKSTYNIVDCGNKKYVKTDDYPIYGVRVARKVAKDENSKGILICGSGIGICIAANKIKKIRAALVEHTKDAYLARKDDDCNVVCLSGSISLNRSKKIIKKFLETDFGKAKRYKRRIDEIKKLER